MEPFIPLTLEFLGTLLIGVAVLRVHMKMRKEHKIDDKVMRAIRREKYITIIGLILITLGYILNFI